MLRCPLCSVSLESSSAEAHIRDELNWPAFRCLLCRLTFFDRQDADEHFRGPLASHSGVEPQLAQVRLEPAKKARLVDLLRQAREGRIVENSGENIKSSSAREDDLKDLMEAFADADDGSEQHPEDSNSCHDELSTAVSFESDESDMPIEVEPEAGIEHASKIDAESPDSPDEEAEERTPEAPKDSETSDAKASCKLCGSRVSRRRFALHAKSIHLRQSFSCCLCTQKFNFKQGLKGHLQWMHNETINSETSCITLVTTEQVKAMMVKCFDLAADFKISCAGCKMRVQAHDVRSHVSKVHLKAVMRRCRLCPYETMSAVKTRVRSHVNTVHKGASVEESIDSSGLAKYAEQISAAVAKFFPSR